MKLWQHWNLKERRLRKLNTGKVNLVRIAYEHFFFCVCVLCFPKCL